MNKRIQDIMLCLLLVFLCLLLVFLFNCGGKQEVTEPGNISQERAYVVNQLIEWFGHTGLTEVDIGVVFVYRVMEDENFLLKGDNLYVVTIEVSNMTVSFSLAVRSGKISVSKNQLINHLYGIVGNRFVRFILWEGGIIGER